MKIERYIAKSNTYKYRCRPNCKSEDWMAMVEWCKANFLSGDAVANGTWFCFNNEDDANRFVKEWEDRCIDLQILVVSDLYGWKNIGLEA